MKNKIIIFLLISLGVLLIAPAINLQRMVANGAYPSKLKYWKKEFYNVDFATNVIGGVLYNLGISISPTETIIGKDQWLFLGDDFASTITNARSGVTLTDQQTLIDVKQSAHVWKAWLKNHGVHTYKVIIGPDKSSVYTDKLPTWAVPSQPSFSDAVLEQDKSDTFIFPNKEMIEIRSHTNLPLYFKTDTHWNRFGAWVAYRALEKSLIRSNPELRFPVGLTFDDFYEKSVKGGDLSNFLRASSKISDTEIYLSNAYINDLPLEKYNYNDMNLVSKGKNTLVDVTAQPLLVKSAGALNNKRVLWLRDSFGASMSPYMSATFSEIIHLHHGLVKPEIITDLIKRYKPDLVIVTCVERNARTGYLTSLPPK